MNLKVAVLTPEPNINHLPYYNALCNSFIDSEITFFTYQEVADSLTDNKVKFEVRKKNQSSLSYLFRIIKLLQKQDKIIIDEPFGGTFFIFLLSLLCINKNMILTIHNINKWFSPKHLFHPKYIFYLLIRKIIKNNSSAFIVISPNLKKYILKSSFTNKQVYFIPFSLPTKLDNIYTKSDDIYRICINGSVDLIRRDYMTVIRALESILKLGNTKIELFLLGRANINNSEVLNLIEKCDSINKIYGKKIYYWTSYVSTYEYEKIMQNTDSFLLNINVFYQRITGIEIYGITKETGIIFSALNYQKNLICVYDYTPPYELSNKIEKYVGTDDLVKILNGLKKDNDSMMKKNSMDAFNKTYREDINQLKSNIN